MKLNKTQLLDLFRFQLDKPIIVTEDNLEDLDFIVNYNKNSLPLSIGTHIFKYLIERNGKYTLYYVLGYDDLINTVNIVMNNCFNVYKNGGIPIFVED